MINTMTHDRLTAHHKGNQNRNQEAGIEAEARRTTAYWCSFQPPTVDCTLPHQLLIKKMPRDLSMGQTDGGIFSIDVPFSQMAPASVKLTKTNKQKNPN